MDDLIKQLEAAKGGSRELDGRIAWAFGWRFNGGVEPEDEDFALWPEIAGHWHKPGDRFADICSDDDPAIERWDDPPHYTTSLDAALTLVPEDWIWDVASTGAVWVMPEDEISQQIVIGGQPDPIIALCIAALKARQHG
jgi:hypothetical protein